MQMLSYKKIRVKFQFFDEAVIFYDSLNITCVTEKAVVRWEVN